MPTCCPLTETVVCHVNASRCRMIRLPAKQALKDELVGHLEASLKSLERAHQASREAATHEEAKPENDKDTRAIEAGYLAGAQAARVRDLERTRNTLGFLELRSFAEADAISLGALIEIETDGARSVLFLAPSGGGMRARLGAGDDREAQVITPASPLGQRVVGRAAGDVIDLPLPGGRREIEIIRVW